MDSKQFVEWLKKENLLLTVKNHYSLFQNIFKQCLNVNNEEVLIAGDLGYPARRVSAIMLGCYLLAAKRLNLNYKFVLQDPKERGEEASSDVIEGLLNLSPQSIVVWSLSGKVGSFEQIGSSFRKFVITHNHRFISSPSLGLLKTSQFNELVKAIDVDYAQMRLTGEAIKEKLDSGNEVKIMTKSGTNLSFDIKLKNSLINDGIYINPRTGGNIPAGEVYIPPRKKGVNGIVVVDACSRALDKTHLIKKPIKIRIKDGEIIDIQGEKEAKDLEKSLAWAEKNAKYPWGIRRVGELGIGMNPGARITNSTLISEKTKGTAHIGIGSNYWFGGTIYAIIHLDQVFKNPKIWIDGKELKV